MAWDEDQKKCGGLTAFGLFTILVSAAMIAMGCLNLNFEEGKDPVDDGKCRVAVHIPPFLVGGGIIFLVILLLRFIFQRLCRKCGECGDDKFCSSLNFACKFSFILLYDVLAFFVIVAVLIFGTKAVVDSWEEVDYEASESASDYCPQSLYMFTYILLIVLWVLALGCMTCGLLAKFCACFYDILCCKPCRKDADSQQNQAV